MQAKSRVWRLETIIRLNRGELNSLIAFAQAHHEKGIREEAETGLLANWAERFENLSFQTLCKAKCGELAPGWANQLEANFPVTLNNLSLLCTITEPCQRTMGSSAMELASQFHDQFKSILNDARRQQGTANRVANALVNREDDRDPPISDSHCYSLHDGGNEHVRIVDDFVDAISVHDPDGELVGFVMADHAAEADIIVAALNSWS